MRKKTDTTYVFEENYVTLVANRHFDSMRAGDTVYADPSDHYWQSQISAQNVSVWEEKFVQDVLLEALDGELVQATVPDDFGDDD